MIKIILRKVIFPKKLNLEFDGEHKLYKKYLYK